MDQYANTGCVLKINAKCETCIAKLMDALASICGVYTINIDAANGIANITGQVDPNSLLLSLFRSGREDHAELLQVKLQHPVLDESRLSYRSNSNNINNINYPYNNSYNDRLMFERYNNYDYNNGRTYPYDNYRMNEPYLYNQRRGLLDNVYDEPPTYRSYASANDYEWHNRNYAYTYDQPPQSLPPARYVPSGPPPLEYKPCDDEPINFCSIM